MTENENKCFKKKTMQLYNPVELVGHAMRFLVFEVFFNVLDQKMEPQVSVKCMNQGINQNCSLLTRRSWAMPGVPIG